MIATVPIDLATGCDALVLVTDWHEFFSLNYRELASVTSKAIIIDGRNFLNRQLLVDTGFYYIGIGCPALGNEAAVKKVSIVSSFK